MIREFWVENYMSIAQKQSLSFLSKGPESALVSEIAGEFLYKLAILFGPNASGKSNMLPNYYPFALLKDKPTRMFVSFYADEIRYDYEISFDETHILSERLDYYPNRVKSLFYERNPCSMSEYTPGRIFRRKSSSDRACTSWQRRRKACGKMSLIITACCRCVRRKFSRMI